MYYCLQRVEKGDEGYKEESVNKEHTVPVLAPSREKHTSGGASSCSAGTSTLLPYYSFLDMSDLVMDPSEKLPPLKGPRLRSLRRQLMEQSAPRVRVRLARLKKPLVSSYWQKLKKQQDYESFAEAVKKDPSLKRSTFVRHGFNVSKDEMVEKLGHFECVKKHRFRACGKCVGCVRKNCGICANCKDKPKFGGHNIMKQKCVERICTNPIMATCEFCVVVEK